jgi:hypothetical protein
MSVYVEGKHGYSARILKDSISSDKSFQPGKRIITFEVTYWRGVLAELNTHCMLARNSSSSRAIPFDKMQQQLTGRPVRFGQANKGMQDKGESFNALIVDPHRPEHGPCLTAEEAWEQATRDASKWSEAFHKAGYHKQVVNRLTEPAQMMKTVITATELENFFWLRYDGAADPSIYELARVMLEARSKSVPEVLHPGEYHLPYVHSVREELHGKLLYGIETDEPHVYQNLSLEDAIKVSGARTAAVSFRNVDYGVEKSEQVFARLTGDAKIHGSAMEHQATPMTAEIGESRYNDWTATNLPQWPDTWQEGITHMDRDMKLWSAKFQGWIMYRKLIKGENHTEEVSLQ